jgi:hypothetical protein
MIIRKTLAGLAFSAALLLSAQANATISLSAGPGPTTGETFDAMTVGLAPVNDTFATFSGGGVVSNGTTLLLSVAPTGDATNYLSVHNGVTETVNLVTPGNTLGLYWGSIDTYNTLTLFTVGGPVGGTQITGTTLDALNPAIVNGTTSEYVTISGLGTITSFTMNSTLNSFETDNYTISTTVPEASTWAMMLIGFASVGFLSYRNRNRRPALRLV